jgi:[acyl-carrier-protein] S-malonyltransferase
MKPVFVFSGQGAQSVGMGKDLFENSLAAASIFKEADSVLGWSVSEVCFSGPESRLTESKICQPAIYTMSSACLAAFAEKKPEIKALASAGLSLGNLPPFIRREFSVLQTDFVWLLSAESSWMNAAKKPRAEWLPSWEGILK